VKVYFITLVCLLLIAGLLATPASSLLLSIEVQPLSREFKKLPVKVYWQPSNQCPTEFNQVLKKTLDTAIALLRKSIWRFMEENDGKFDEMVNFRIEYVNDPEKAQIIITGKDLEEGVLGETWVWVNDRNEMMHADIYYDCDVVLRPVTPAFNVVLHELLHGLGLGHTQFDHIGDQWEIMAEYKREGEPTIYVSSLDLYALHQIWYTNYRRNTIALSKDLEFREIKPYVIELEELKQIYEELHQKYGVLEEEVASLKDDLKILEKRVEKLEQNMTTISTRVSSLENKATSLEEKAEVLSETMKTISSEVTQVAEGLESVNTTMNKWMVEVGGSLETLSTQISENKREIQMHSQLLASQQQAIESLNTSLQEAMKYLKILTALTAVSLALATTVLIRTLKKKERSACSR